jgi:hypothetical protein
MLVPDSKFPFMKRLGPLPPFPSFEHFSLPALNPSSPKQLRQENHGTYSPTAPAKQDHRAAIYLAQFIHTSWMIRGLTRTQQTERQRSVNAAKEIRSEEFCNSAT